MRIVLKFLAAGLWLLVSALPASALDLSLKPDLSAPSQFFAIVDTLKSGAKPSDGDWNSLFETQAYTSLSREEFPRTGFKIIMSVAFAPDKATERTTKQDESDPSSEMVRHLIAADARRDEIMAYLARLDGDFSAIANAAERLLAPYVPAKQAAETMTVPVTFALFGNDARGYRDAIVFDALFAMEADENLPYWLAHELHHFYRNAGKSDKEASLAADRHIIWTLGQLQAEGIADLIDKPALFYGDGYMANSRMAEAFRYYVDNAPTAIEELENLLVAYAEIGDGKEMLAADFQKAAPLAGHPTGYFMASQIERQLGRDTLIASMGNPFDFIRLYNKAAGKANLPGFFGRSGKVLKRLEKAAR